MLRPDTQALWERLRQEPGLAGFVLIGGSALALHLGHRTSEDLDFVFAGTEAERARHTLPRRHLDAVLGRLREAGIPVMHTPQPGDVDEFEATGMDLSDHQQSWQAGAVSLSFFMPDAPLAEVLRPGLESGPRLASLDELFASKALVAASRSKTRDWFDLYYLMTERGYTMVDFAGVYARHLTSAHLTIALNRLCSGRPGSLDEGFTRLLPDPPTLEKMTGFFRLARTSHEQAVAAQRPRLPAYPQDPPSDEPGPGRSPPL